MAEGWRVRMRGPLRALRAVLVVAVAGSSFGVLAAAVDDPEPADAAPTLTITPTSWDVIGLDSNKPNGSPITRFPVSARVCNTSTTETATGVQTSFAFNDGTADDTVNQTINLSTGHVSSTGAAATSPTAAVPAVQSYGDLSPGECIDSSYFVSLTTNPNAFTSRDRDRFYRITASSTTAGVSSVSTPAGRKLYVEQLVSQNRNSVLGVSASVPGSASNLCNATTRVCDVYVGQQVEFTLMSKSAPGGYEQSEAYLTLPPNLLRIDKVKTYWSAPSGATSNGVYGDGCGWDPVPTSATYKTCIGPAKFTGGKVGGNPIKTVYTVTPLASGTVSTTAGSGVQTGIYDLSGGSYHYNSDVSTSTKIYGLNVVDAADLSVSVTNTSAFTRPSSGTTNYASAYTVTMTNNGESSAAAPSLTFTIPATAGATISGVTINSGSWGTCAPSGVTTFTCSLSTSLAKGASASLSVGLTVNSATNLSFPDAQKLFTATAAVSSSTFDPKVGTTDSTCSSSCHNTAYSLTTTALTNQADLQITKSHTDARMARSASATYPYTLVVKNNGPATAASPITVTDTLPAGMSYVPGSTNTVLPSGWSCSASGQVVTCTGTNSLALGATATLSLGVSVSDDTADNVTNVATVSSPTEDPNSGLAGTNNTASDPTIIGKADLVLTKTHSGSFAIGSATEGSTLSPGTFTLQVENKGPDAANGTITVTDTLPTGLVYNGASGTGWTCPAASGQTSFSCTRSTAITSGEKSTITVSVKVLSTATHGSLLTNVASVTTPTYDDDWSTDGIPNDTNVQDIVEVVNPQDLEITLTGPSTCTACNVAASANATIIYNVSVKNNGTAGTPNATGVYWIMQIPQGMTFNAGDPDGAGSLVYGSTNTAGACFDYSSTTEILCQIGTIAPGATVAGTITLNVPTTVPATTLSHSATAYMNENDSVPSNDTKTITTTVTGGNAPPTITWSADSGVNGTDHTEHGTTTRTYKFTATDSNSVKTVDPTCGSIGVEGTTTLRNTADTANVTLPAASVLVYFTCTFDDGALSPGTSTQVGATVYDNAATSVTNTSYVGTAPNYVRITNVVPVLASISVPSTVDAGDTFTVTPGATTDVSSADTSAGFSYAVDCTGTGNSYGSFTTGQLICTAPAGGTFTVKVKPQDKDGGVGNEVTSSNISVANAAPTAADKTASTNEDTAVDITLTGADSNGDTLTFTIVSGPSNGTLSPTGSGMTATSCSGTPSACSKTVTYTPTANYSGSDSFTYRVNDGTANSNTATVNITVNPANDTPVANGQSVTTPYMTAKDITLTATDADGGNTSPDSLTWTLVSGPSKGTLSCSPSCSTISMTRSGTTYSADVTYTPSSGSIGSDSFVFKANDGTVDSSNATVNITIEAGNLSIAKSGPSTAVAGASAGFDYTIDVTNAAGATTAADVVVTDTLDSRLTYVDASSTAACSASGQVITCPIGTIAANTTASVTIHVTVKGDATGTVPNTATVSSSNSQSKTSAQVDTDITVDAELSIVKTASADPVAAGASFEYSLNVENAGPSVATTVAVTDILPAGLSATEGTLANTPGSWTCTVSAPDTNNSNRQTLSCTRASWGVGTAQITIPVTLASTYTGTTVSNTATITGTGDASNESNNTSTKSINVKSADLSVEKRAVADADADPLVDVNVAVPGASAGFDYRIVVSNGAGFSPARNVVLTDVLDSDLVYVDADSTAGCELLTPSETVAANTVSCPVPSPLAAGSSAVIVIHVTVPEGATGSVSNVALAAGDNDPGPNPSPEEVVSLGPVADLSIDKTGPASISAGKTGTYSLLVKNLGPSTATTVEVEDVLPAGVSINTAALTGPQQTAFAADGTLPAPSGWACAAVTADGITTVTCTRASWAKDTTGQTISIPIAVASTVTSTLSNTATIAGTSDEPESDDGDNTDTATTTINPADLSVTKTAVEDADADPLVEITEAVPGDAAGFDYRIVVTNASAASPARNVVLTDVLDADLVYVDADSTADCSASGQTVTCPLTSPIAAGDTRVVVIHVTVAEGATGTVGNIASAAGDNDPGPNPSPEETLDLTPVADLSIDKTGPASISAGKTGTYSLLVKNLGPSTATTVEVEDVLPAGVSINTAALTAGQQTAFAADGTLPAPSGWACDAETADGITTVTCTRATWAKDTTGQTISIPISVASTVTSTLSNTATITGTTDEPESDNGDNTDTATTTINPADLSVTKTAVEDAEADPLVEITEAVPGDAAGFDYRIVVTNASTASPARNVVLTDVLDSDLVYVDSDSTADCSASGQTVTCPVSSPLAAGSSATVVIHVTVAAAATGTVGNIASAAGDNDPGPNPSPEETLDLTPVADLSIDKTGPASISAGKTGTYSLLVKNLGPSTATTVEVEDELPAGVSVNTAALTGPQQTAFAADGTLPAPSGWACAAVTTDDITTVTCTRATWAKDTVGQTISIPISVASTVTSTLSNTATITGTTDEPASDDGDNTDTATTTINPADLSVTKTAVEDADADPLVEITEATPGDAAGFDYRIVVTNASTASPARNVVLTDVLDSDLTYVDSDSTADCSASGQTVTCPLTSPIAAGDTRVVVIHVTVAAAATGTVGNIASAAGDNDPGPNPSPEEVVSLEPVADLSIDKTGPASISAGKTGTYSLLVKNLGPATATDVEVEDVLPSGVSINTAALTGPQQTAFAADGTLPAPSGWACDAETADGITTVTCTRATWAKDTTGQTISIPISVASTVTSTLSNTATITGTTDEPESDNGDNTDTATTTINPAELSVTKTAVADADADPLVEITEAVPGDAAGFDYRIVVTNASTASPARNVVLTDVLDSDLVYVDSDSTADCSASGQTVTCPVSSPLAAGSSATVVIHVTVAAAATGTVSNIASAVGDNDPGPNPSPEETLDLTPVADLSIDKTGPASISAGKTGTYSLLVKNLGPSTATTVEVEDALPAGVSINTAALTGPQQTAFAADGTLPAPSGWACAAVTADGITTVTCTRASWAKDTTGQTISIPISVASTVTSTLSNTATIAGTSDEPESDDGDNTDTATTTINPADLSVTKTAVADADADPLVEITEATPGDAAGFDYRIVVTNASAASPARNVVLTDVLDSDLVYVDSDSTADCSASGQTVTCPVSSPLAAGSSATVVIHVTVAAAATGTVGNIASAAGDNDPGPNPSPEETLDLTPVADLSIDKTGPVTISAGKTGTYSLLVKNLGPSTATTVEVEDVLPAGVSINTAALTAGQLTAYNADGTLPAPSGWACDAETADGITTVTCTRATWAKDTTGQTISIPISVASTVTSTLSNTATIASTTDEPASDDGDNTDTATTTINPADLSVTKTAVADADADPLVEITEATPGDAAGFDYRIVVTNASTASPARNVVLTDVLDSDLTYVDSDSTADCSASGQTVTCPVSSPLAAGSSATVVIHVTVAAGVAAGDVGNVATVVADNDPGPNPSPEETVTLTPEADLSIVKSAVDAEDAPVTTVQPGDELTYTLAVTNTGPSVATGVSVTDTLPEDVAFAAGAVVDGALAVTPAGWSCAVATSGTTGLTTVTCTRATWAVGTSTIELPVVVDTEAVAVTTIENDATITGTTDDPDEGTEDDDNTDDADLAFDWGYLSITKTGPTSAAPGDPDGFSYTITVTNGGPAAVRDLVVTDVLDARLTYDDSASTAACSASGQTVTCPISTLAAADDPGTVGTVENRAVITIHVTVPANASTATAVSNSATVEGPNGGPKTGGPISTTLEPVADLGMVKSAVDADDDPVTTVQPGDAFTYVLEATNHGPSAAVGAVVTDTLPEDVAFADGAVVDGELVGAPTGWTCAVAGAAITCTKDAGSMAVSATPVTFEIPVVVDAEGVAVTSIVNTATVDSDTSDDSEGEPNSDDASVSVDWAYLSIVKTAPASAAPGDPEGFDYTITVTNSGPAAARDLVVTDFLDSRLTYVDADSSPSCAWVAAAGLIPAHVECTISTLAAADDAGTAGVVENVATVTIHVTVAANADTATQVANTATVEGPNGGPKSDGPENTTLEAMADLEMAKSAVDAEDDPVTSVQPGDALTYVLAITNHGPSAAEGVVVTDTLPEDVAFAAGAVVDGELVGAPTGWTCAVSGAAISCTKDAGSMAVSATPVTFELPVVVDADGLTSATIVNSATVDADTADDPEGEPNTDDATVTVDWATLSIVKSAPATAVPGADAGFDYTITVTNSGPAAARSLVLTDVLDADLTYVDASSTAACSADGQTVTCPIGGLAAADDAGTPLVVENVATVTIHVTVDEDATGEVQNTATVEGPNGGPKSDGPETTTLEPEADLVMVKSAVDAEGDPITTVQPGDAFTYELSVTNGGPSAAVDVEVTDTLPSTVALAAGVVVDGELAEAPTGWTCAVVTTNGVTTVTCTLDSGTMAASATPVVFELPVVAASTLTASSIVNSATVSSATDDPDEGTEDDDNTDDASLTVDWANLTIVKSAPATAVPGADAGFDYTITVTNSGPAAARDLIVTDVLDADLTYVDASSTAACSAAGQTVTCPIATLAAADDAGTVGVVENVAVMTIHVLVDEDATGTVQNTATVEGPNGGPKSDGPETTTLEPEADLVLVATAVDAEGDPITTVQPGDAFTYELSVTNEGPSAAADVEITDTLPSTVALAAGAVVDGELVGAPTGWTCAVVTTDGVTTVTCTKDAGTMAVSTTPVTFELPVVAASTLTASSIVDEATVTSTTDDPDETDNTDDATLTVDWANLSIVKSAPATAVPGADAGFDYTITVTNSGPAAARSLVLTDVLDADLTYVDASSTAACSADGQTVTCPIGGLAAADDAGTAGVAENVAVVTIHVLVDEDATGTVQNTATVEGPNGGPKSDGPETTSLEPEADLSMVKSAVDTDDATVTSVQPGDALTYELEVTNSGPSAAVDVEVTDTLPSTVALAAGAVVDGELVGAPAGWTCAVVTTNGITTVTCTLDAGTMPVSATPVTFELPVVAASTLTAASIVNSATVSSATDDPDEGTEDDDNTDDASVTVDWANLTIVKSAPESAVAGTGFAYTLTISNSGPAAARDLVVTDVLDERLAYNALLSSAECALTAETNTVTCDIASIAKDAQKILTVYVTVDADAATTPAIENSATVEGPNGGPKSDGPEITTLEAEADLVMVKSAVDTDDATVTSVQPGDAFTYELEITNEGPSAAVDVEVTDTLPSTVALAAGAVVDGELVGAPAGWTCAVVTTDGVTTVTCTLDAGTMPVSATPVTFELPVVAASTLTAASIVNSATVSSATDDPDEGTEDDDNTDDASVTVDWANLTIVKSAPSSAAPGDPDGFDYTITVTNAGPAVARDLVVTDVLDARLVYDDAGSTAACSAAGQTVTCPIGSLAAADDPGTVGVVENRAVVTIHVTVPADADDTEPIENSATVEGPNGGPKTDGPEVTSLEPVADLGIVKTAVDADDVEVTEVQPEDELTYVIEVTNAGPSAAASVVVTDTLPEDVTIADGAVVDGELAGAPAGWTCEVDVVDGDTTLTCTLTGDLVVTGAEDDPVRFEIPVVVADEADLTAATIVNTATVDAVTADDTDPDAAPNSDDAMVDVDWANLTIVKTAPASATPGAAAGFDYTITVTNNGPAVARDLVVTDFLDYRLTYDGAESSPACSWVVDEDEEDAVIIVPHVECTIDTLAIGAGAAVTLDIHVTVDADADPDSPITNTATVEGPNGGPKTDGPVETDLEASADLAISKSVIDTDGATVTEVQPGDEVTYVLDVTNAGPSTAEFVEVVDTLPAEVTLADGAVVDGELVGAPEGWTCTVATADGVTSVTCVLAGDLDVTDDPVGIELPVVVDDALSVGTITNTASVDASTPEAADTLADNTDTASVTVDWANLTIVKSAPATAVPGADAGFDYTITVTNSGPAAARSLVVTDVLDADLTYVDASSTAACSADGQTVTCPIATLAGADDAGTAGVVENVATLTIHVLVDEDATGTVQNTATVEGPNGGPKEDGPETTTLEPEADLSMAKSAVDTDDAAITSVQPGDAFTYELAITNSGPSAAASVSVTDTLPSTVELADGAVVDGELAGAPAGWTCAVVTADGVTTVTCTLDSGTMAVSATPVTFELPVVAADTLTASSILNSATVTSTTDDPDEGTEDDDNTDDAPLTVDWANLSIEKAAPATATPGSDAGFDYTITVTNDGPAAARDLVVTDVLDSRLTFDAEGSSETCAWVAGEDLFSGQVECTIATIEDGASADVTIHVTVDEDATGEVENAATVEGPNGGPKDTPEPTITTLEPEADLSVAKSATTFVETPATDDAGFVEVDVTEVDPGEMFDYVLEIRNAGPSSAVSPSVTDVLPLGLAIDATGFDTDQAEAFEATGTLPSTGAWTCVAATEDVPDPDAPEPAEGEEQATVVETTVSCTLGGTWSSMDAEADPVELRIPVVVDAGYTDAAIVNTATITSSTEDPDEGDEETDNSSTWSMNLLAADLAVEVTAPVAAIVAGDPEGATYTIDVVNNGLYDAVDVEVTIPLPAALAFEGALGTGWTCTYDADAHAVTCTRDEAAVGELPAITLAVTAGDTAEDAFTVAAHVEALTPDPDTTNNDDEVESTPTTEADLSIEKTSSGLTSGEGGTYTLTVTNLGPSVSKAVTVTDVLPEELGYVAASVEGEGWTCDYDTETRTISCSRGTASVGELPAITFSVSVGASQVDAVSNTGSVSSTETTDPEPDNDSDTFGATPTRKADLFVEKTGPASVEPGDEIEFTIEYGNAGSSQATGVTISDTISANFTDVSVPEPCTYNEGTRVVTCSVGTVAVGGSGTITIDATVADTLVGRVSNTATISSPLTDPDQSDNSSTARSNRPPDAVDDSFAVQVNNDFTYALTATDVDADTLTFAITSPPAAGSLGEIGEVTCTTSEAGVSTCTAEVTYSAPGTAGDRPFEVTVSDGEGGSTTFTVTAEVFAENEPPTATIEILCSCDGYTNPIAFADPNQPKTNDTLRARVTVSDPDLGDTITLDYEWWVNGVKIAETLGTGALQNDYDLSLVGKGDLANVVTAVVKPTDGKEIGLTAEASVQIKNSAPTATNGAVSVRQDSASGRTVTLSGVDPDSQTLQFRITQLPTGDNAGTLYLGSSTLGTAITSLAQDDCVGAIGECSDTDATTFTLRNFGSEVTYKPKAGYFGPDAFQFQAGDTTAWSANTATVSVGVFQSNVVVPSTISGSQDGTRITRILVPNDPPLPETPIKTTVQASALTDNGVNDIGIRVRDVDISRDVTTLLPSGFTQLDFQQNIRVYNRDPDTDEDLGEITWGEDNAAEPFMVAFNISAALVPDWVALSDILVYRDEVAVVECLIEDDPDTEEIEDEVLDIGCRDDELNADRAAIVERVRNEDGSVTITIAASHASDWNFGIPLQAPNTSIVGAPAGVTAAGSSGDLSGGELGVFQFTANQPGASFDWTLHRALPGGGSELVYEDGDGECTFDVDEDDSVGTVSCEVGGKPDGLYTFRVWATVDDLSDLTPARRDVVLDRTAPVVTITSGPDEGEVLDVDDFAFGFSSNEPGSVFECRLDKIPAIGDWTPLPPGCATPKSYTNQSNGEYRYTVRATDTAGNNSTADRLFEVDVPDDEEPGGGGGGGAAPPTTTTTTVPVPVPGGALVRVAGRDRVGTAQMLARTAFPDGADVVYIATARDYADALSAGPAAVEDRAPVLLTQVHSLDLATAIELRRLAPDKIVVVGGWAAVSDEVFAELRDYAGTVVRVAGVDRFGTAAELARDKHPGGTDTVYVATGLSYPDALAAGLGASTDRSPVILSTRDRLPQSSIDEITRLRPSRIVIVGGTAAVSAEVEALLREMAADVERVAGKDRYATMAAVNAVAVGGTDTIFVATGKTFGDALTGIPVAAMTQSGVLMIGDGELHADVVAEMQRLQPKYVVVLGGTAAIAASVEARLAALMGQGTGEGVRGLPMTPEIVAGAAAEVEADMKEAGAW